jgi:hypothetical protein
MQERNARYSADEHAQTSVSEHGDRHSPRLAWTPDGAGAAHRGARGGRAATCRQDPSSRGAARTVSAPGVENSHSGRLRGIGAANRDLEDPDPRRRSSRDQRLRIDLPARQWRLRDARDLSRLNDFLAL